METNDQPVYLLTKEYLELKSELERLEEAYKGRASKIEEKMKDISDQLSHICEQDGATSIKTPYGTVIRAQQTRYHATDWGAYHEMVIKYNAPYLLQKRIMESALKEFLEDYPEARPAGLNVNTVHVISVRRPKG